jgi:hypothetical protein
MQDVPVLGASAASSTEQSDLTTSMPVRRAAIESTVTIQEIENKGAAVCLSACTRARAHGLYPSLALCAVVWRAGEVAALMRAREFVVSVKTVDLASVRIEHCEENEEIIASIKGVLKVLQKTTRPTLEQDLTDLRSVRLTVSQDRCVGTVRLLTTSQASLLHYPLAPSTRSTAAQLVTSGSTKHSTCFARWMRHLKGARSLVSQSVQSRSG